MRMLVFFDLPTETAQEMGDYRRFRKMLLKNGFIMMQESVYCKLLVNTTAVKTATDVIRKNRPPKGIVQVLTITEKQFAEIEYVTGEYHTEIVDSDERLVIL